MAVRRESVVLTMEDRFTTGMAKAAAATALMNKNLDDLSGQAVHSSQATRGLDNDVDHLGSSARRSAKEIDSMSGRVNILRDALILLGPAAVGASAVSVAALSGITAELGFATVGAGTAILAFQGVGDALKAVNEAALDPTAANLEKARDAMAGLSKEGQDFVRQLHDLQPALLGLRDTAAAGLLPGVGAGLDALTGALPRIQHVIAAVSGALGDIAEDVGESFASERWAPFLDFLAEEAPSALTAMATGIWNATHGLAELWMATTPLNNSFSDWLVRATADFDEWATHLSETEGLEEFLDYVERTGPQVASTLGAIANMFLQIAEAAAPLAGPVLHTLEAVANAIAKVADSDLGTPIFGALAALTLYNRALMTTSRLNQTAFGKSLGQAGGMFKGGSLGRNAALAAGLTATVTGLSDKMGLANTTALAMAGTIATGGPWGAAIGAGIGLVKDFADSMDDSAEKSAKYAESLDLLVTKTGPSVSDQLAAVSAEIDRLNASFESTPLFNGKKPGELPDFLTDGPREDKIGNQLDQAIALRKRLEQQLKHNAAAEDFEASAAGRNAAAHKRQAQSLRDAITSARNTNKSWNAFGNDLDDKTVSLDKWIQGRANQARDLADAAKNAKKAIENGLRPAIAKQLLDAGPDGARRLRELAGANAAQIRAANAARVAFINAAKTVRNQYADIESRLLGMTRKEYLVRLRVDLPGFYASLGRAQGALGSTPNATVAEAGTSADGGTVPKTGRAYADRHLYLLADGEEVISNRNGQADRWRPMLKAINGGLADGGTSGGSRNLPPGLGAYIRRDLDMKLPHTLKQWNRALEKSTKVLDKEREKRDALIGRRNDLSSTVRNAFRSDLFNQEQPSPSVWSSNAGQKAGIGGLFSTLKSDIGNASAFGKALKTLKAKGLKGGALAEVAASGDLEMAQALAASSAADVQKFQALYTQRQSVTSRVGQYAGNAVYGQAIAAQVAETKRVATQTTLLRKEVAEIKADFKKGMKQVAPRRRG